MRHGRAVFNTMDATECTGPGIGKSVAAGDGVIGFIEISGAEIVVGQRHRADRKHDPQRNGYYRRNDEFQRNHFVGHR